MASIAKALSWMPLYCKRMQRPLRLGFCCHSKGTPSLHRYNVIILCELYIHFCFIQGEKIVNKVPSSTDIYFAAIEIMIDYLDFQ